MQKMLFCLSDTGFCLCFCFSFISPILLLFFVGNRLILQGDHWDRCGGGRVGVEMPVRGLGCSPLGTSSPSSFSMKDLASLHAFFFFFPLIILLSTILSMLQKAFREVDCLLTAVLYKSERCILPIIPVVDFWLMPAFPFLNNPFLSWPDILIENRIGVGSTAEITSSFWLWVWFYEWGNELLSWLTVPWVSSLCSHGEAPATYTWCQV